MSDLRLISDKLDPSSSTTVGDEEDVEIEADTRSLIEQQFTRMAESHDRHRVRELAAHQNGSK